MPFRDQTQFDIDALKTMTAAYDAVVARLKLKSEDPAQGSWRSLLIVDLARAGVLDVDRLADQARAGLK